MNPFYFGRSERPLFGLFTRGRSAPGGVATEERAVLLCYPVGSEYLRAHRAFRQLNTLLNRNGFHVLRFDYACTGDSGGDGVEASFDEWVDDVDWAIDELLDTAGVETLDIVGLRWGAALAALGARERDEVRRLVLWDPVVTGESYFDEVLPHRPAEGTVGIEGYPFTTDLRAGLAGVDLRADLAQGPSVRTAIVVGRDDSEVTALAAALEQRGDRVTVDVVPSPGSWAEVDPFGDALIPQDQIKAIIDRLLDAE